MPDPTYGLCPATSLPLLDGAEPSLAELAAAPGAGAFAYAVDRRGRIAVAQAAAVAPRAPGPAVELTLDDGSVLRCHPAQPLLLRDGDWKPAADLTIDDSLFAAYFDTACISTSSNDYLRVLQPTTGQYEYVHYLADDYNKRHGLALPATPPWVRHHANFDRFDNRPTNIVRMNRNEHIQLHAELAKKYWQSDEHREQKREQMRQFNAENPELREERRQKMIAQNQDAAFRRRNGARTRRMWQDGNMRLKILGAMEEARNNPIVRQKMSRSSKANWQNPEYRAKYANDHHSQMALKLWENPEMRDMHREKIQRQWEDPAFRAAHLEGRKREYAERMERNPNAMAELTEKAAAALTEKWQNPDYKRQVMRSKIAGYAARLLAEFGRERITPELYDQRRSANWIPKSAKLGAYFDSFDELLDAAATHNHRVVAVRWLDRQVPLCAVALHEFGACVLANGIVIACPTHTA